MEASSARTPAARNGVKNAPRAAAVQLEPADHQLTRPVGPMSRNRPPVASARGFGTFSLAFPCPHQETTLMADKVRVAIVGLGFGAEFIPIFQAHPNAEMYAVCQRTKAKLDEVGDKYGIKTRYTSYAEMLKDPDVDAVHINSPIADHAPQAIAALKAGKHVASTVPVATTIDECRQIVEWQRKSGKVYMMMETVVYSREYLFVKELYDAGKLGRIQFLRGSHQQDMAGWPGYWEGFPPMHYATHCVSPCLALLGKHAEHVVCHGSGRIDDDLIPKYGSPFAIETATFKLRDSDVCAEVTRSLFA